jgi:hypothetical protein
MGESARAAGIGLDTAYALDGLQWCSDCSNYVTSDQCPHWDYES